MPMDLIIRAAFDSPDPHAALCRALGWANAEASKASQSDDWTGYRRWSRAWDVLYAAAIAYGQGARDGRAEARAEAQPVTVYYDRVSGKVSYGK